MSGEREVSAARTRVLVRHLRRVYGAQALARVLELGAWERTPAELEDTNAWFSEAESSALFEAAASVTGDPDIARAAGDEADAEHAEHYEKQTATRGILVTLDQAKMFVQNVAHERMYNFHWKPGTLNPRAVIKGFKMMGVDVSAWE